MLQLAGTCVLAVGLWLRLDPKTKGLFEGSGSPYVFYTGEVLRPRIVIMVQYVYIKFRTMRFLFTFSDITPLLHTVDVIFLPVCVCVCVQVFIS